jgi:SHS2 domain-containing protein
MAKSYALIEHAADIGIEARADTLEELLEALAEGLAGVICPLATVRRRDTRALTVQAEEVEATTVDFLNALLRLMQVEHFLVTGVAVRQASPTAVSAELAGEPYDVGRHEIVREVKAVTYHELKVAREGRRWFGRVICDL